MSFNKFMLYKEIPHPDVPLRIINRGVVDPVNGNYEVTVRGGTSSIYQEDSAFRLLYKKRDMDEWKTVPSAVGLKIEGEGNYIDFKFTRSGNHNSQMNTTGIGHFRFFLGGFYSEVQGNIDNFLPYGNSQCGFGLFSGNIYLQHASGLTLGSIGAGANSVYMHMFNACTGLKTPPVIDVSNTVLHNY